MVLNAGTHLTTVRQINSTTLTLVRADEDDLDISCTRNTHYYDGAQRIKREKIKPGDRVSVETKLDLYLKPEAVNVRVLPEEKDRKSTRLNSSHLGLSYAV